MIDALEVVARAVTRPLARRSARSFGMGFEDLLNLFTMDGALLLPSTFRNDREVIESSFLGYIGGAYERNGVIFAALATRYLLFSQARFLFAQLRQGQVGNLFGTPELGIIETPQDGHSTADLLARMMLDSDLSGWWVARRQGATIRRLRPDWTSAVFTSPRPEGLPIDPDSTLAGFAYQPGGYGSGEPLMKFSPDEIAWYAPTPDGLRNIVGMSWLTPVLRDVMADTAATIHKLAYFRNATTPNLTITLPPGTPKEKAEELIELFEQEHRGASNAWRSIYLSQGWTAEKIGSNLQEVDYRNVTAAGESRIAMAAMVHPVLLGSSEALQGSALNAGNFAAAARWAADRFLYSAWGNAAGSLQRFIRVPNAGAKLWYDTRHIPFLRNDVKDQAALIQAEAAAMGQLIKDGFEPGSVVDAVTANGDWARLVHTGLVSVQLQPPGTQLPARAQIFVVSQARLHELLAEGWTPAGPAEEETIRRAFAARDVLSLGPARAVRAIDDFWPASGRSSAFGLVPAGTELMSDHPVVRDFGCMFEEIQERPGLLVSRTEVVRRRTELLAAGRPAGIDALAREMNVSRETIRRRLKPGDT